MSEYFVFDGACPFCSTCARFIVRWIPTPARVVAWQLTDIQALGLTVDEVNESVRWVGAEGRRSAGPEAIADLLRSSQAMPWRVSGTVLARRPVLAVAHPLYSWISRHRDRIPLGPPILDLPPSKRDEFADPRHTRQH